MTSHSHHCCGLRAAHVGQQVTGLRCHELALGEV